MREDAQKISNDIICFIEKYKEESDDPIDFERDFNDVSLNLFNYQFKYNKAFKKLCQMKRKTPLTVKKWRDIPLVPIQGFKELTLSSEPIEDAEAVFMTSGTTDPNAKGRNYHPSLTVWDASMTASFKQFVLPDRDRMTIFVLSPAEDINQNSSLSRYLSNAVHLFGSDQSQFFFHESGLDLEGVAEALQTCEHNQEPVMLIGATFSYVHLIDYLKENSLHFKLAEGSRIFDTGGFKGQSREVEMASLYLLFQELFQIGRNFCINMYGMTELSSQIYDQTIRSTLTGNVAIYDKTGSAWVKTMILNPDTLEPVNDGEIGVIAHIDLANWNASQAILTEDLGCKTDHGFVLLGRVQGSEARGCSIAIDQLIQSNKKS